MTVNEFIERVESDMTTGGRTRLRLMILYYLNSAMRALAMRLKKPMVRTGLTFSGVNVLTSTDGVAIMFMRVWKVRNGKREDLAYLSHDDGILDASPSSVSAESRLFWRVGTENQTDGIFVYALTDSGLSLLSDQTEGVDALGLGTEAVLAPSLANITDRIPYPDPLVMSAITFHVKAQLAYDMGQIERGATLDQLFERSLANENIDPRPARQQIPDTHMLR